MLGLTLNASPQGQGLILGVKGRCPNKETSHWVEKGIQSLLL